MMADDYDYLMNEFWSLCLSIAYSNALLICCIYDLSRLQLNGTNICSSELAALETSAVHGGERRRFVSLCSAACVAVLCCPSLARCSWGLWAGADLLDTSR